MPPHPVASTIRGESLAALQALSEPTRARIVAVLNHGEHCVCDVSGLLGLSTALVSHHLRVLHASGLVRERRSGRWAYYSLDVERLARLRAEVDAFLTPIDEATAACVCSGCGPARRAGVAPLPVFESIPGVMSPAR